MMLVDNAMESATIIDKVTIPDGYGGVKTKYVDGASIKAAFTFDDSTAARIAEQEGTTNRYKITTRKNINLQYKDIIRREKDKKIFKVTSDGDDNYTPSTSALNMRQVEAEEWELPNE